MLDTISDLQRVAELMARQVLNDLNPEETQELRHWKAVTPRHDDIIFELTDIDKIVARWEYEMLV